jgi:hypothetical protein
VRLAIKRLAAYENTGLTPDEIAALRAELDAAQRRADSAVGWADCIVDVMTSSRIGIVEERFSALAGYRKWRETDRRGPDAPQEGGVSKEGASAEQLTGPWGYAFREAEKVADAMLAQQPDQGGEDL